MRTAQRISDLLVGGRVLALAAVTAVLTFLVVFSGSALASSTPSIEGVSVSYVGQHDAGLTAWINPKGLSVRGAVYQFQVVTNPDEFQPEIVCPGADALNCLS